MQVSSDALSNLWARGYGRLGIALNRRECESIRSLYAQPEHFRSRIDMARYRFGRGEYQYFSYPLPAVIEELRQELYGQLGNTARECMAALSLSKEYPADSRRVSRSMQSRWTDAPDAVAAAISGR